MAPLTNANVVAVNDRPLTAGDLNMCKLDFKLDEGTLEASYGNLSLFCCMSTGITVHHAVAKTNALTPI